MANDKGNSVSKSNPGPMRIHVLVWQYWDHDVPIDAVCGAFSNEAAAWAHSRRMAAVGTPMTGGPRGFPIPAGEGEFHVVATELDAPVAIRPADGVDQWSECDEDAEELSELAGLTEQAELAEAVRAAEQALEIRKALRR